MIETQPYIRNKATRDVGRLIDFAECGGQKWVISALSHML